MIEIVQRNIDKAEEIIQRLTDLLTRYEANGNATGAAAVSTRIRTWKIHRDHMKRTGEFPHYG